MREQLWGLVVGAEELLATYGWVVVAAIVVAAVAWPRLQAAAREYRNAKAVQEGTDPEKTAKTRLAQQAAMERRLAAIEAEARRGEEELRRKRMAEAQARADKAAGRALEELATRELETRPLPQPDVFPLNPGFGGGGGGRRFNFDGMRRRSR
ncbi:hypothetical protein FNF27_04790 [Cafeteria roenbergensis]|uniref:Selenoprotein S n=1 Tax=Cafeteria roenbergensis TaxID=33653 RepID=A0A5A8C5R4_CAFRO|nr:hypothetical protein FNF28_07476 [Cafeteria roenbergensis]KAA0150373.1 hypothetical protein FNF29_05385 [Cafeteria roenbergensis]KAA0173640.1 hypothetical protein FNF27_04790 [Cafeteria roenbergensis]|mmetsp:Transcript_5639/g.23908  ORF Transcript_5639/g.23908 Transcript_5639/m.23908 type:complete len:153 (+) Transcript_5639:49-507(+)|eukprot:KAA0150373.1 hypothetical protein FNF29_05385 [Cafeteria roenbergensis]